ncbi:hypothetical protein GE300_18220 [Rhodobacteraceae bacterium 2CG4]|uniref:Uncharacterized protein n=1 Tax=Halovulum marinum TaxID=2662447 RepID=A0A6L5Z5D3_9RHOB|nr:hypothetical protein [Halovulum marinum]MSU91519.1 hypothetical protein [Halovulum marinum]
MRLPTLAITLAALAAAPLWAQDQTGDPAAADEPAEDQPAEDAPEAGAQTAAPAQQAAPQFNGTAAGTVSGVTFDVPVLCTGFPAGPVTAKSDPDTPGEDGNGDGVIVDVAAQPDGQITMTLMAGGISFGFDDDTATLDGNRLDYSVTISFVGGQDDTIEYSVVCDG